MSKLIDLTGKRFGRLTVLERDTTVKGTPVWICKCDCGTIKKIRGLHLKNGVTLSCGCLNKEATSKARSVDLTGQRFGKLVVTHRVGSKNGRALWHCECDCGGEINVISSYLRFGETKSCGCVISYREVMIENFLKEHNILFKKQYTFSDLRGKKYPLRFDFAVLNADGTLKCLIEYQGEQHYSNVFKVPDSVFQAAKDRDIAKKEYCLKHNIRLVEINKEEDIISTMEKAIQ